MQDLNHIHPTGPSSIRKAPDHARCYRPVSDGPPRYERARSGSLVDAYEPRIRELLAAFPRLPATVIAERIGWRFSIRTLSGRVAELRPAYLPPDPASRTVYAADEIAQCDFWFPDIELPVGFGQPLGLSLHLIEACLPAALGRRAALLPAPLHLLHQLLGGLLGATPGVLLLA
jgi:hypothetical protein